MKLYLLTAVIHDESETPVHLGTDLEAAKAAAVAPPPAGFAMDWYHLYEAEDGAKPVLMLETFVRPTWDRDACKTTYSLDGWTTA